MLKIMTMHWPPYTTVHWFIVHSVDMATVSGTKKKENVFQKVLVTVRSTTQELINVLKVAEPVESASLRWRIL
jgi:hypothetical protein